MRKLYDLEEGIRRCIACPLWENRTLAVPGEGKGKVMFIGDYPEVEENRIGRPFIGPSGELFDKLLELSGLTREDCFVTNVCKCHPKSGHVPDVKELKVCKEEWLDVQIAIIKPKLIVLMGELALKSFFGGGKVSKLRGKIIDQKYFVINSPSEALKSSEIKKQLKKDAEKLKEVLVDLKI
jgi:uracil-DNA glycosylase